MILSPKIILELNKEHKLLENLCKRELTNPEGVGFDLRVGQVHKLIGDSFLAADETGGKRYSSKTIKLYDIKKDGHKRVIIKPGDYYLVTTMEKVNSPSEKIKYDPNFPEAYLVPKISPRSSLQRGGISLHFTGTDPGYHGELTFGIKNQGDQNFSFQLGARMFSVEYHVVYGDIFRAYDGQHQGGRPTSGGKEEKQN